MAIIKRDQKGDRSTELKTSIWKYMEIGWVLVTNRNIMDLGWKYIHIANVLMTTSSILWDYWWKYILTLERFQWHMVKYMEIWKSLVTTRAHRTTSMEIHWKGFTRLSRKYVDIWNVLMTIKASRNLIVIKDRRGFSDCWWNTWTFEAF
jgi:hypothetical protein